MARSEVNLNVTNEIGALRRVLIHSPDAGIGVVIPAKAQDWLYEDIVSLKEMQDQYDFFKKLLLAYVDPDPLKKWFEYEVNRPSGDRSRPKVAIPGTKEFVRSEYVIEAEDILATILNDRDVRTRLVASIGAVERIDYQTEQELLNASIMTASELATTLITGVVPKGKVASRDRYIFPPVPNFVFTRDIGVVLKDHLLLSRTANPARLRESLIIKYLAYYYLLAGKGERIIEIKDEERWFLFGEEEQRSQAVSIEGGDVMMIHPKHLLVGCSERTSEHAIDKLINQVFNKSELGIEKVSVIMIPHQRSTMHIDTIFTQVARDTWVVYPELLESVVDESVASRRGVNVRLQTAAWVIQYQKVKKAKPGFHINNKVTGLKELLYDISCSDYGVPEKKVRLILCGNGEFPFSEREQWSDACNVVALREGVVVGYDLNNITIGCFENEGFQIIHSEDVVGSLKADYRQNPSINIADSLKKIVKGRALILLPSSELSRARGGSHCMTMPLWRDPVK